MKNVEQTKDCMKECVGRNRGQSMVETALVLPILILILVAIIDFGFLFNSYIVLSNASREGARNAAVGMSDTDIGAIISSLTGTMDDTKLTVTISPEPALRKHGAEVSVLLVYDSKLLTPIIGAFFPDGTATLQTKAVMRVE